MLVSRSDECAVAGKEVKFVVAAHITTAEEEAALGRRFGESSYEAMDIVAEETSGSFLSRKRGIVSCIDDESASCQDRFFVNVSCRLLSSSIRAPVKGTLLLLRR